MILTTISAQGRNPSKTEGGVNKITVSDDNLETLLERSLKELKKMNLQMSIMTDNEVTNAEIE